MTLGCQLDVTITDAAVEFSFTVVNDGEDPVDLTFSSGKVTDVAAFEDGVEVWRWSDGRMFTQALETETLEPDDALVHEATWDDPPAGAYVAEASLSATDSTFTERQPFEVS